MNEIMKLTEIRYRKYVSIIDEAKGSVKHGLKLTIQKMAALLSETNGELAQCEKIVVPYLAKQSTVGCLLHSEAKENCFFGKEIWNSKLVTLDTGCFRISLHADAMLKSFYKDYWNTPTLENRIREVLKHYKWLIKYGKIQA